MAAAAAGADGLIIEVHNDPANALCDGPQSITPEEFARLSTDVMKILEITQKRKN
jgi:3-deoxy-7-phosphoheptulonate synthase